LHDVSVAEKPNRRLSPIQDADDPATTTKPSVASPSVQAEAPPPASPIHVSKDTTKHGSQVATTKPFASKEPRSPTGKLQQAGPPDPFEEGQSLASIISHECYSIMDNIAKIIREKTRIGTSSHTSSYYILPLSELAERYYEMPSTVELGGVYMHKRLPEPLPNTSPSIGNCFMAIIFPKGLHQKTMPRFKLSFSTHRGPNVVKRYGLPIFPPFFWKQILNS
jgi:hypothetical protein